MGVRIERIVTEGDKSQCDFGGCQVAGAGGQEAGLEVYVQIRVCCSNREQKYGLMIRGGDWRLETFLTLNYQRDMDRQTWKGSRTEGTSGQSPGWFLPGIPAALRQRQKEHQFWVSLGSVVNFSPA